MDWAYWINYIGCPKSTETPQCSLVWMDWDIVLPTPHIIILFMVFMGDKTPLKAGKGEQL